MEESLHINFPSILSILTFSHRTNSRTGSLSTFTINISIKRVIFIASHCTCTFYPSKSFILDSNISVTSHACTYPNVAPTKCRPKTSRRRWLPHGLRFGRRHLLITISTFHGCRVSTSRVIAPVLSHEYQWVLSPRNTPFRLLPIKRPPSPARGRKRMALHSLLYVSCAP